MKKFTYFLIALIAIVVSLNQKERHPISNILFGETWDHHQYCNNNRTDVEQLKDDELAQYFFNGSDLANLEKVGPGEIRQLITNGIIGRKSVSNCYLKLWGYADRDEFADGNRPHANETECLSELDQLHDYMRSLRDPNVSLTVSNQPERFVQLSSFGRPSYGPIHHSFIWLGDYDSCRGLESTRHCFGAYGIHQDGILRARIKVSLCMPRSCTSELSQHEDYMEKIDSIVKYNSIQSFGLLNGSIYKLVDIHCPPADDSHWMDPFRNRSSIFLIVVSCLWCSALAICTLFPSSDSKPSSISWYFNLKNNWKQLTRTSNSSDESILLDIMRVVGMANLVFNHLPVSNITTTKNLHDGSEMPIAILAYQGHHIVSMFFIIGAYVSSKPYIQNYKRISPANMIIHRYLRLVPIYFVIYTFTKNFAHIAGSGPLWDHGISPQSETRQCLMESPLVPLLLLANLGSPFSHCILTGWYVANDFQLFVISIIVLKIYHRSRLAGRVAIGLGFAVTQLQRIWNLQTATNFSTQQFFKNTLIFGTQTVGVRLGYDYVNPIGRIGSYFSGILIADLTSQESSATSHKFENEAKEPEEHRNSPRTRTWFAMSFVLLAIVFSCPLWPNTLKLHLFGRYNKALAYNLSRFTNDLGMFLLIYSTIIWSRPMRTSSGHDSSKLPLFFRSSIWTILLRLNYCFMLSHYALIRQIYLTQRQLPELSILGWSQTFLLTLVIGYSSAGIMHLALEIPLTEMARRLYKFISIKDR